MCYSPCDISLLCPFRLSWCRKWIPLVTSISAIFCSERQIAIHNPTQSMYPNPSSDIDIKKGLQVLYRYHTQTIRSRTPHPTALPTNLPFINKMPRKPQHQITRFDGVSSQPSSLIELFANSQIGSWLSRQSNNCLLSKSCRALKVKSTTSMTWGIDINR